MQTKKKLSALRVPGQRRALGFLGGALLAAGLAACSLTPEPMTPQDQIAQAIVDQQAMYASQEPVSGPIALDTAMARALKYNLQHRLALMQRALEDKLIDVRCLRPAAQNGGHRRLQLTRQCERRGEPVGHDGPHFAGALDQPGPELRQRQSAAQLQRSRLRSQLFTTRARRPTAILPPRSVAEAPCSTSYSRCVPRIGKPSRRKNCGRACRRCWPTPSRRSPNPMKRAGSGSRRPWNRSSISAICWRSCNN